MLINFTLLWLKRSAIFPKQMEYSYLREKKIALIKNKIKLWVDAKHDEAKNLIFLQDPMEQTKS